MTLEEIIDKKWKLRKELDELKKLEEDINLGDIKKSVGKYYKITESLSKGYYIKVEKVWESGGRYYLEGLSFFGESGEHRDCINYNFYGWTQFVFSSIPEIEHCLEEVTEDEFCQKFFEYSDQAVIDFDRLVHDS